MGEGTEGEETKQEGGRKLRKVMAVSVLVCCTSILVGCSPRQAQKPVPAVPKETWSYDSISNPVENKDFIVSITPEYWSRYRREHGWHGFILSVTNKTNKNIEIVWDKTLFILKENTNGRFMYEGVVYSERNNSRPNDIIFGNTTFRKMIIPNNLVEYIRSVGLGWFHNIIPPGETGIYITIKIDEKEISEKVMVNIRKELNNADSK